MPKITVEEELAKLKRRQQRNMRAARAHGLMQGIVSMLKPGDVVLDCGANLGNVTAPLAATGAHVHAFEPDPYAFKRLQKRFQGVANVTLHNAAVGPEAGSIRLMRADNFDDNPKGASVKSTVILGGRRIDEDEANSIEVEMIDLPAFIEGVLAEHGEIAFLKMDIEGAELELLEVMHARRLIEPVRLTVAETHEKKFKHLADRFAKLREDFAATYPVTKIDLDWI